MPATLYEKDKILDICFEMFIKHGYKKTTTAMLAKEAGISKALLFHHFKSKKNIYISLLERIFDKKSSEISEEAPIEYKDYFEARANSGHDKIAFLKDNPKTNKLLFEAFHSTPDELKEDILKFTINIRKRFGHIEANKEKLMKKLFSELNLREGVDRDQAYELTGIVTEHFRKQIAIDLTDESKIDNEEYWESFFRKRKDFLNMIRYGIEAEDQEVSS